MLLALHTFKIATVSYTVIDTYEGKFDSPSHAVSQRIYVRKTSQLSLSMMDAFVLVVLHTSIIATVSYMSSFRRVTTTTSENRRAPSVFLGQSRMHCTATTQKG